MRILVVDDDRDSAWSTSQLLTVAGYESRYACDGDTCCAEVASFHPDSILLDLRMPGRDGYSVALQLRKSGYTGRIVALTGVVGEGEPVVPPGFDAVLIKPAKLHTIERALTKP